MGHAQKAFFARLLSLVLMTLETNDHDTKNKNCKENRKLFKQSPSVLFGEHDPRPS